MTGEYTRSCCCIKVYGKGSHPLWLFICRVLPPAEMTSWTKLPEHLFIGSLLVCPIRWYTAFRLVFGGSPHTQGSCELGNCYKPSSCPRGERAEKISEHMLGLGGLLYCRQGVTHPAGGNKRTIWDAYHQVTSYYKPNIQSGSSVAGWAHTDTSPCIRAYAAASERVTAQILHGKGRGCWTLKFLVEVPICALFIWKQLECDCKDACGQ